MKRKSLLLLTLCLTTSMVLTGCSLFKKDAPVDDTTQVEEQPAAVNLSNVTAGTILDTNTLIQYACSLSGVTDINAVACYTETESAVTEVTLQEGIHTITIAYSTADGSTGETQLTYEASPATEEFIEVEESTDIEQEEFEEVAIPIENRITLNASPDVTEMTYDEFVTSEDITISVLSDYSGTKLSMNDALADIGTITLSNKFEVIGIERSYMYDDDNYTADVVHTVYQIDNDIMFHIHSENASNELVLAFKNAALDVDAEGLNDICNEIYQGIEDLYTVTWNYDAKVIDDSETASEETEESSEEQEEILDTVVKNSYKSQHPELYIWPESDIKCSRWDYRITDSTSFKTNITLEDGTVIPFAQQNQDGYQYNFDSNTPSGSSGSSSRPSQQQQQEESSTARLIAGFEEFDIKEYPAEGIKVDFENATDNLAALTYNGSTYYVKVVTSDSWIKFGTADYYGNNLPGTEIILSETIQIGSGADKKQVTARDIQFTDVTGATATRSYMYGINCNNAYLIVVGEELPTRGSNALKLIVQNCIIPVEKD